MSLEPKRVPEEIPVKGLGSLRGCLVDGDAEQRRRERSVRRRSLAISVVLQSAILASLLFVSLFGKGESIALANVTPIPPYGHHRDRARSNPRPGPTRPTDSGYRAVFPTPNAKPVSPQGGDLNPNDPPGFDPGSNQPGDGPECNWCVDIGNKNSGPRSPQPPPDIRVKPQLVHQTTIDPAMLIRRIEPIYPILAKQTHREGRVELRAIIGTDGTIQSLQIVIGDVLFQRSALDAVQQWRYRPTILNGQAVEVDTYITVIYTMPH